MIRERIVQFGPGKSLLGIATLPAELAPDKPALILTNSGLLHHVGPFGIYVTLARRLADAGFVTLRMDLSGKGESRPRRDSGSYQQNVLDDITDAMDHLQNNHGVSGFIILGVCTGADNAYQIAQHDDRVVGIVPIDGYAYRTMRFYVRHYGPKIFALSKWRNLITRKIADSTKRLKSGRTPGTRPTVDYKTMFPPRARFTIDMQKLLDKGVKTLIVYSGGWAIFYNYEAQLSDAFPKLASNRNLQLEFNPKSDHTYILRRDRDRLVDRIHAWANENF